jgi:hypothetical protein
MLNQGFRKYGSRMLAVLTATLGFAACGESPTEPDPVPQVIFVQFEASGVVQRDGQPVRGAKVVLMRCEWMGADGCEEEKSLAIAMTNSKGEYALKYTCECMPGEEMPEHSLLIEMPAVVSWDRVAGGRDGRLIGRLAGDPDDEGNQGGETERSGYHQIDPECVEILVVNHDFALGN